jgi:hypothetical protein
MGSFLMSKIKIILKEEKEILKEEFLLLLGAGLLGAYLGYKGAQAVGNAMGSVFTKKGRAKLGKKIKKASDSREGKRINKLLDRAKEPTRCLDSLLRFLQQDHFINSLPKGTNDKVLKLVKGYIDKVSALKDTRESGSLKKIIRSYAPEKILPAVFNAVIKGIDKSIKFHRKAMQKGALEDFEVGERTFMMPQWLHNYSAGKKEKKHEDFQDEFAEFIDDLAQASAQLHGLLSMRGTPRGHAKLESFVKNSFPENKRSKLADRAEELTRFVEEYHQATPSEETGEETGEEAGEEPEETGEEAGEEPEETGEEDGEGSTIPIPAGWTEEQHRHYLETGVMPSPAGEASEEPEETEQAPDEDDDDWEEIDISATGEQETGEDDEQETEENPCPEKGHVLDAWGDCYDPSVQYKEDPEEEEFLDWAFQQKSPKDIQENKNFQQIWDEWKKSIDKQSVL